jgi:membrane-bound lytic murein transglycosylase D
MEIPQRLLEVPELRLQDTFREIGGELNPKLPVDAFEKDILQRLSTVYGLQVQALEAQSEGDAVATEALILDSLEEIRTLLDEYPEIQNNRRFTELYRTVMAEYEEFYGISEPVNKEVGEVFAIREELMMGDESGVEDFTLPASLSRIKTTVPLIQNDRVNRHLVYYTLRRPDVMETWLQRFEQYEPMMRRIFKEEGVPQELMYLSFIESGLQPTARSWAAAVGLWQFIRATGTVYGLEVNWWVDERRDPEKSTRAAARHLKDLYNIWNDWHLALANYNISPRGLNRAIRSAGGKKDFWVAYPYLPRETRNYVPGYIAATMIAMNPEEFGFERNYGGSSLQYDVYEVDGLMPLDELAKALNISTRALKKLNPELLRWATPPGNKYPLKIPAGTKEAFAEAYSKIPKNELAKDITFHTVKRGESLGKIAHSYGTTVQGIYASNENLGKFIYPGQRLAIPLPPGSAEKLSANRPSNQKKTVTTRRATTYGAPANSTKLTYKVKTGDTIGHIAEWYDVRAWQLRTWNGIGNTIRVGQNLTVYVPKNLVSYYDDGITGFNLVG